VIIISAIISAWSWKKISFSITGDAVSCSVRFNHVVIISNESFKTLFVELKSNALICHVRIVLVC
jgi:hypothetical protein